MNYRYASAALLGSLALYGCAAAPVPAPRPPAPSVAELLADQGLRLGPEVDRVPAYGGDGWAALDREHLIIGGHASRRYLLSFSQPCQRSTASETMMFKSSTGDLTRYDQVYANADSVPVPCFIESIHELQVVETASAKE